MSGVRVFGFSLLALTLGVACADQRIASTSLPKALLTGEEVSVAEALPPSYLVYLRQNKQDIDTDEKVVDGFAKTFIIAPEGQHALRTNAGDFLVMDASMLEKERAVGEEKKMSDLADNFDDYVNSNPYLNRLDPNAFSPLPRPADRHQPPMPIRNQGKKRQTCVAHASVAALEMFLNDSNANLSEEYAHHLFLHGRPQPTNCCTNAGVLMNEAAEDLSNHGIPLETAPWTYRAEKPNCDRATICESPSHAAAQEIFPQYHATRVERVPPGTEGAAARNPAYLETLIAGGANIVYSLGVAWNEKQHPGGSDPKKIIDVKMKNGAPLPIWGVHAVLLVGYDRDKRFFIGRNSFSDTWGHSGYGHFSYDYIITYGGSGYIIRETRIETAPQ